MMLLPQFELVSLSPLFSLRWILKYYCDDEN